MTVPTPTIPRLQVLRYQHDQKYDAHWDYFFHKDGITNGGNRFATVLMYLVDTVRTAAPMAHFWGARGLGRGPT